MTPARKILARQARRAAALRRAEIADAPSTPRTAPAGPVSAPVKVMDETLRALIDAALRERKR